MFKWSGGNSKSRELYSTDAGISSGSEGVSILRNTKGKKKQKTKKKKKVDRSVTWSKEFMTYEERSPAISFEDYNDDYSDCRDTFEEEDDESQIPDYNTKASSMFTPIQLPKHFRLESRNSEDDASLIETMDNYYDGGISKAASDDNSLVSYERIQDIGRQRELDSNLNHLGLVMPSLGGLLSVLGVAPSQSEDATSMGSHSSYRSNQSSYSDEGSEYVDDHTANKSKESSAATKSKQDKAKADKTVDKAKADNSATKINKAKNKKEAKSTSELNLAIKTLETHSSESSDSGIEVRNSGSGEIIEPLISDEVSESGNKAGDTAQSSKKKKKFFGFKNKPATLDSSRSSKKKGTPVLDVSKKGAASLVDNALAQQKNKDEPQASVGTSEVKSSFSASRADGSDANEKDPFSAKKGERKTTSKKSLKNGLSFRRKGKRSTILSGKELAFAYAQQQLAPLKDMSEHSEVLKQKSSEESASKQIQIFEPTPKNEAAHKQMQKKGSSQRSVSQMKLSVSKMEKKVAVTPVKTEKSNVPVITKEVKKPAVRATFDQPKVEMKETAPATMSAARATSIDQPKMEQKETVHVNMPVAKVTIDEPRVEKKETPPVNKEVTTSMKEKKAASVKKEETISTKEKGPLLMKKEEETSEVTVAEEEKKPAEKAIICDLPESIKEETAPVNKKEPNSEKAKKPKQTVIVDLPRLTLREHLYNDILRADSFDSVSTTEDILEELQQIEEAAQKMYQSMVIEGGND